MSDRKAAEERPTKQQTKKAEEKTPEPVPEGVYVALEPLLVGAALAFAPGDRVPAEHVNKFDWQDKVRAFDDTESEG